MGILIKNVLIGCFWARVLKILVLNQHPQICLIAKFWEKTRIPNFGTKSSWFRYFWAAIWKQYCDIWNQHPRICLIAKFSSKLKMPKFGSKKCLIWVFLTDNGLFVDFLARILKKLFSNDFYFHFFHYKFCERRKIPEFGTQGALFG